MTLPQDLSQELGESEYSHGGGMFPHPDSDFQKNRTPFPQEDDIDDDFRDTVAIRRSDPTVADETTRDLLFEKGNPDRFGGQSPIVRVPANRAPSSFPVIEPKTRVDRAD